MSLREGQDAQVGREEDALHGPVLGLDPGAKTTGWAVYDPATHTVLAMGQLKLRQDIKGRMDDRRGYRRGRRNRLWYRPKRFDNRASSRRQGRLPPTMTSKLAANLALIRWIKEQWSITQVVVEEAPFDVHALKKGVVKLQQGWQYQRGELYGYENSKIYVRIRDDYTCQCCLIDAQRKDGQVSVTKKHELKKRTQQRGVQVGHLLAAGREGTSVPSNLVVLCKDHNDAMGQGSPEEFGYPELWGVVKKPTRTRDASHVSIYVPWLIKELETMGIQVVRTVGSVTKVDRENLHLPKEHYNDAIAIASRGEAQQWPDAYYHMRWMGRPRRQRHDANALRRLPDGTFAQKKGDEIVVRKNVAESNARCINGHWYKILSPNRELNGFHLGDFVEYQKPDGTNVTGFIQSLMSKGTAVVCGVDGLGDKKGSWSTKKLRLIARSPRLRWELAPVSTGRIEEETGLEP